MSSRQFVLSIPGFMMSLWYAGGANAAPPIQATAQAARTTVQVGEPVRITIQVLDSEEVPQIDAPRVDGMNIRSTGIGEAKPSALRNIRSHSSGNQPGSKLVASLRDLSKHLNDVSSNIPNDMDAQMVQQYQALLKQRMGHLNRSDYSIVYLATPEKVGPITVPPFTIHADGQTAQTQSLRFNVIEPRPSPWVKAALSLSNPEPSVGETVNLYVDLLVRRWVQQVGRSNTNWKAQPINHVTLNLPSLEGYQEVQPLEPLEQFVEKRRLPRGQLGYHINQFPGVILLEQEPAGTSERLDPHWYRRRLTIPFRAVRAGEMEVAPVRIGGEVYVPSTAKDRYTWEGFVASSMPLKFHILEAANRPTDSVRQPSRLATENAPAGEQPPAGAEQGNEDNAAWLTNTAILAAMVAILLAIVPIAVVLHGRSAGRKQRLASMSRQWQAIEQARQRLRAPLARVVDVSAALQDFLRAYLELAPGEITPEESAERLSQAGYPVELAEACAEVLRACAAQQFAPSRTMDERSLKVLILTAERLIDEVLATKPKDSSNPPALVDDVSHARQAALAD